mgnify:CR=1 FL=1
MKYEIIRNGEKIAGSGEYDPQHVRDIISRQGGDSRLVPNILTSAVKIATITIKPVREIKPNLAVGQRHVFDNRVENEGDITYNYIVQDIPASSIRASLKASLSGIHDRYEAARFDHRGVMIKADLEARTNATAVLGQFSAGMVTSAPWRGRKPVEDNGLLMGAENGESSEVDTILVSSTEEMENLYAAIITYLAKGFEARATVEAEIEAATDEDIKTYDASGRFHTVASS